MKNQTIKTDQIQKGDTVKLRGSDWIATIEDGYKNRIYRLATVQGYFTETGSIYVSDIYQVLRNGSWQAVEIADKHRKKLSPIAAVMNLYL